MLDENVYIVEFETQNVDSATICGQRHTQVNIIAKPSLRRLAERHALTVEWVEAWIAKVSSREWGSLLDVQQDYPSADHVCSCLIFNVLGNNYRLIVGVWWSRPDQNGELAGGRLYIKHLLTHAEYDKNKWRKDCGCDD